MNHDLLPEGLALPTAVEIHNVVCSPAAVAHEPPSTRWHHRPQHSIRLLNKIRLEITIIRRSNGTTTERTTLCNRLDDRHIGVAAGFHHLNDILQQSPALTPAEFESMQALFYTMDDTTPFFQLPIHPSRLCRIQQLPTTDVLPINCVAISFSDHSLRIHPAHYQLLLKASERIARLISCNGSADADHGERRFEETAFCKLDDVSSSNTSSSKESSSIKSDSKTNGGSMDTVEDEVGAPAQQSNEAEDQIVELQLQEQVALSELLQRQITMEQAALVSEQEFLQSQQNYLQQQLQREQQHPTIDTHTATLQHLDCQIALARIRLIRDLRRLYPISSNNTTIRGRTLDQPGAAAMAQHCAALMCKYLDGIPPCSLRDQVANIVRTFASTAEVSSTRQASLLALLGQVYDHVLGPEDDDATGNNNG